MSVFGFLLLVFAFVAPIFGFAATPSQYGLKEGDLISAEGDPDVYIINEHGFKRLFLNPAIFGFYGHFAGWESVKTVSSQTRDAFPTSLYFKNCEMGSPKVYALEVTGEDESTLHWLNAPAGQVESEDTSFSKKVFCINDKEFRWYTIGGDYSSMSQVSAYKRGVSATTTQMPLKAKKLVRVADDPKIYYLAENETKKHIISPEVFESYKANRWEDVAVIDKSELDSYPTADLVRKAGSTEVYRLEAGKKRLIPNAEVFKKLGFDGNKVVQINDIEFNAYPTGSTLTAPQKPIAEPDAAPQNQEPVKKEDTIPKKQEPPPSDAAAPPPQDISPPAGSAASPSGILTSGTTQTTLSLATNENATCRYAVSAGIAYDSMANTFTITGALSHSTSILGLTNGTSYIYYVRCRDVSGNKNTSDFSISFSVASPPPDTTPPLRSNQGPSGTLAYTILQATLSLTTSENATCRFSTNSGTNYDSMSSIFSTTGGASHSVQVSGLAYGESYTYYVRCVDAAGNKNTDDVVISFSVATLPTPTQTSFLVKPYLVYPADKVMYAKYEISVKNYLIELQNWYRDKVGKTFSMNPLQVVRSSFNYLTMRCGPTPSQNCLTDSSVLEGNWGMYMNKAIHNGVEQWESQTAALIFSAGGGGYGGANLDTNNNAGWGITGDWVLEPISGVINTWGIPCSYSAGWQCAGGVPRGSPAHELGHAFGLGHPDPNIYSGSSIMKWHGDYPTVGLLQHEINFLLQSPFFP